jgi:radical SAM superfamily enzyme YgiQ (UPF0313 family)
MNPPVHSVTWNEMQRSRQRLSGEIGTIIKDWGGKLPFAFVYPNSYYIGMSNLGLQTVYSWLNTRDGVVCERAFWDKQNTETGALPVSVETQRPLNDFAVLAFSLNYEIDYFNIAPLLRASGLPIYSRDRDESYPLVIAGGPCITANPMPIAAFFDCLCIGEAEALLPAMLPLLEAGIGGRRNDLLKALSSLPGIYVPRLSKPAVIERQWIRNLDDYPAHSVVLARETELKDLYLIEVERGCSHQCRFCLVSNAFSPVRFHSVESILKQAEEGLNFRRRIGLVGPSVTDHPQIEEIFKGLISRQAQFSPSSLRITSVTPALLQQMIQGGLRSVAIAPEAGSEHIRKAIKKGISEIQVLEAIRHAAEAGIQQIKLYFMVGLPGESDQDIQEIIDLVLAGKSRIEKKRGKTRISVNISPFVPKAGTPFQWLPMESIPVLQKRISYIKNDLANQGVEVKNESPQWSEVQAVLSRGDYLLAEVLADVQGTSLPAWREATSRKRLDVDYYAHRKWDLDLKLPWQFLNSGRDPDHLKNELTQALV